MKIICLVASFFIFCIRINAQPQHSSYPNIDVFGFHNEIILPENLSCFIDSTHELSISQIRQINFNVPYSSFSAQLNQNPLKRAFWLKFNLHNNADTSFWLYIYTGTIDYTDVYFISPGHEPEHVQGGYLRSVKSNSYVEKTSATLPLHLQAHQSGEIFVRLVQWTEEYSFNGIEIYDRSSMYASYASDYENNRLSVFFEIIFQGFLLCQLLYVLFQWMIIRRPEYLYYFFYLLTLSLYFFSKYESDYGIYFLFSRYPLLKVYLNKTLIILPYFFYFRFVRSFLEMYDNYPHLNKWIIRIEYFLLAYLVFDFAFIIITLNVKLQREFYTYVLIIIFTLAASFIFYLFKKRQALIYYILSGSLFVGLGNIIGLILTYLSDNENIDFGVPNKLIFSQVGILLEILCFTAGLSYKSKSAEKEKIKSQEKLIEQLKANEALQSKMQNIRNKIAQDLHDDIGSTLSSISILSNIALKEKNATQTFEAMSEIKDSSINLMEKMDDIVWSINPRNDSLENLLLRIKRFAITLFEAKNIDYNIAIHEDVNGVKLPMDYRQHIYLILKEAINNLVKYAEATKAIIDVNFQDKMLSIEVRDNGKGFSVHENLSGNGILSMKNRAELMEAALKINSIKDKGTSVTLEIKIK